MSFVCLAFLFLLLLFNEESQACHPYRWGHDHFHGLEYTHNKRAQNESEVIESCTKDLYWSSIVIYAKEHYTGDPIAFINYLFKNAPNFGTVIIVYRTVDDEVLTKIKSTNYPNRHKFLIDPDSVQNLICIDEFKNGDSLAIFSNT